MLVSSLQDGVLGGKVTTIRAGNCKGNSGAPGTGNRVEQHRKPSLITQFGFP